MTAGRALALALALYFAGLRLHAQSYSHISGFIVDASGASVPGALITVVSEETGFRRSLLTLPDGAYVVSGLQPGTYKVTVRRPGFRTMIRFGVKVAERQPARADFRLVIGAVQETVTVEGSPPVLDRRDASVETWIGRDAAENLPLNGRGLLGLVELTPGVIVTPATRGESGQFTVNGQRPNTHVFSVDGVSANSGVSGGGQPAQSTGGALPGMTAFGSMDSSASLESIQEIRVQTSTTVPEFGRMPGAQVSVNSRSGSNELHGSVRYAFRNEVLEANNWFANRRGVPRAPLSLHELAPDLGGPLRRDRTFFFASYQRLRMSQPFVWDAPVPSLAARSGAPEWAGPVLNLFPQPNGADLGNGLATWTGNLVRPSELDAGAARIDHALTPRVALFGRYSDSASATAFGANPVNWLDLRSRTLTAGVNVRVKSGFTLESRLNWSTANSNSAWREPGAQTLPDCFIVSVVGYAARNAGGCDSLVRLTISGLGRLVSGPEGTRRQTQFQVAQTAAWMLHSHALRFGGDYRSLTPDRHDSTGSVNLIASSVADLNNSANFWIGTSAARSLTGLIREASLFAQDTWQVTSRLLATYGLRWEISPAPVSPNTANYLDASLGYAVQGQRPLWASSYANLAPRLGLAYRLNERGRTVIRAGAGLYYDSSLSLANDLLNDGPLNVAQYGSARHAPFSAVLKSGFLPDLRLPRVLQWNVSLEQALSGRDVVSAGYAASSGDGLIRREAGGLGSSDLSWLVLATNRGESSYHSLQMQYRRRWSGGLEALVSYAWAHSIDNSSTDGGLYWAGPGLGSMRDRASSDFDVRHALTAGFTYELPRKWAVDGMFRARSGFPVNVLATDQILGINFENIYRPDRVGGQPVWLRDASSPGGRRLNPLAFRAVPGSLQGNLGRNAIDGFGMFQLDAAVRREFRLSERCVAQLRVEAFNITNHANFADPVRYLSSPIFGQSTSMLNLMLGTGSPGSGLAPLFQSGGARSLQVALKFRF